MRRACDGERGRRQTRTALLGAHGLQSPPPTSPRRLPGGKPSMRRARLALFAAVLLGLAVALRSSEAQAQSRSFSDYVLLAADAINANGLTLSDGDVAVLDGVFASSHTLAAASPRIAAPLVHLDPKSSCSALLARTGRGAGTTCGPAKAFTRPFASVAEACGFPTPFPACDPSHPLVVVPHGGSIALPPGTYGDVA